METDYKTWCRLCGSLEATNTPIGNEVKQAIQTLFQHDPSTALICENCTNELLHIGTFIAKVKSVDKMFRGLDDEDPSDLTVMRLNAYRNYFKLTTKIAPIPADVHIVEVSEDTHSIEADIHENEDIIEEFIVESEEPVEIIEVVTCRTREEEEPPSVDPKLFNFQCHLCDHRPYATMSLLTTHCRVEHNAVPSVRCCSEECGKMLSTWRRLMIHKEMHFPEKGALRCDECHAVFCTRVGFEKHIKTHESLFICSFCAKTFTKKKTLTFHEMTHQGSLDERRQFECPHCQQKFITKQTLHNHIKQKHEKQITAACPVPKCGKSFFSKKAMLEHQRTHRERLFECEFCDHKTKTKSNLNAHLETHSKREKTFECDQCGSRFGKARALKNHMLIHSSDSPYHCEKCDKKFKRNQELVNHLNVHYGIKPHTCSFCPRSFTNLSNLRKHSLKDHKEELQRKLINRND